MTYNIQGHAARGRGDHLAKLAEVISAAKPDVVGLQEVHCRTKASSIHQGEQLAELTGMKLVFGRSCGMDGGGYGNAILTRGEVRHSHVYPLPGSGEPRSLLQTDLEVDGSEFTFNVTHLAAWGRLLRVARLSQIAELGDITARGSLPHVLVGDFNVPPGEVTFPMTRQRLDYVFCDPRMEYVGSELIRRGPSDHWPIVVDLKLRDE